MTWQQAKELIFIGCVVRRSWWQCKRIRSYRPEDADYFAGEFDTRGAIVEECEKTCDCSVGVYNPEPGDQYAADWEEVK